MSNSNLANRESTGDQPDQQEAFSQRLALIQLQIRSAESKLVIELEAIRSQLQAIERACADAQAEFDSLVPVLGSPADDGDFPIRIRTSHFFNNPVPFRQFVEMFGNGEDEESLESSESVDSTTARVEASSASHTHSRDGMRVVNGH